MNARKQILSQLKAMKLNQKKMAELLGMSESQFSQSLRLLSDNFVERLREKGINIDGAITQNYKGSGSSQTESDMHGNFIGNIRNAFFNRK